MKGADDGVEETANQAKGKLKRLGLLIVAVPLPFLLLPYIVGVVWHGLHPIASILTGDMKLPRRWYIDENSLDPSHFQMNAPYNLILQTKYDNKKYPDLDEPATIYSLCQGIRQDDGISVPCHRHKMAGNRYSFEVAKIVPLSGAVAPVSEAIVLVVPPFEPFSPSLRVYLENQSAVKKIKEGPVYDKSRPQFQASILQLIRRMASPRITPWLAKTIFVVSPIVNDAYVSSLSTATSMNPLLEEAVEFFLDSYLGKMPSLLPRQNRRQRLSERLPLEYTGAILRHVIVLDLNIFPSAGDRLPANKYEAKTFEPEMGEVRLLAQGRRGVLPNMDLTFLVRYIYDRSTMTSPQQLTTRAKRTYTTVQLAIHPYRKAAKELWLWLKEHGLPEQLHAWARQMLTLLSFEYVMAVGPYPPHAPALDRGIDALTIQGVFVSATDADDYDVERGNTPKMKLSPQQYPMELVQKLEYVFRGLSNLHERLHHSTSLYLLASSDRFVKHEEYLVPNLLLVIPCIIRAILLVFRRDKPLRPDLAAAGTAIAIAAAWAIMFASLLDSGYLLEKSESGLLPGWKLTNLVYNFHFLGVYFVALLSLALVHRRTPLNLSSLDALHSIQFAACLLTVCIHVSIAFGHVSLAYPSALLWTPLIAFPNFRETGSKTFPVRFLALLAKAALFSATCPFTFLVPHVFPMYTTYVRYAYLPLHMMFCILHIVPA